MHKVHILPCCDYCDGDVYLSIGEAESSTGNGAPAMYIVDSARERLARKEGQPE